MAVYDILFHDGAGHPYFLDGGIIIIKPHNSVWNNDELQMGVRASINLSNNDLFDTQFDLLKCKVNDKANPTARVKV